MNRHRLPLREARERRPRPNLDRKLVSSWNGLATAAFARGARILGEPRLAAIAGAAADRIWTLHHRPDGLLARASTDGIAGEAGVLGDHANLAAGLLELHQAGQEPVQLERARELCATVRARFAHGRGGFYLTAEGQEAPLGRQLELFDSVRPSGNAVMLSLLCRLSALDGDPSLREEAERALVCHAALLRRAQLEMAGWFDAAELLLGPILTLVVAGHPEAPSTRALLEVAARIAAPHVLTVAVPAEGPSPELSAAIPVAAGKRAGERGALAYVCRFGSDGGSCSAPTDDPAELRRLLLEGWRL